MAQKKPDLLTERQRHDLLGLSLVLVALFTALSLIPTAILGGGTAAEPGVATGSGNFMGVLGAAFRDGGRWLLGTGLYLVPAIPLLAALAAFGLRRELATRWGILALAMALLVPIWIGVTDPEAARAGWWGTTLAGPLTAVVGGVGAVLLVIFVAAAACIVTIGWNPARTAAAGAGAGLRAVRGAVGSVDGAALARSAGGLVSGLRRQVPVLAGTGSGVEAGIEAGGAGEGAGGMEASAVATAPGRPAGKGAQAGRPGKGRAAYGAQVDAFEGAMTAGPAAEAPPVALLEARPDRDPSLSEKELDRLAEVLIETLRTFKVEGRIVGRTTGPVVTQYEFAPAPGIKVSRIEALDADLALALKAPSVRIVAPIPGKGAVGVEVPNPVPEMVYLREIVDSPPFQRHRGQLPLALGKDLEGRPYVSDLSKMPHLLIAGATGSGKSICINTIITSLVYRHSPETLRLLMVDPKMVELSMYGDLPHLRHPVVTDPEDAGLALRWAVYEMERRYELLSANQVRSIAEFNQRVEEGVTLRRIEPDGAEGDPDRWIYDDGPLPYVVIIVDELADLMMTVQSEVERPLAQLAQKARAIGIHLIVATQRPSVNVITGLIKANFPCRIGFRVSSKVDSRTILDQNGADALLGNGDMLFLPPGTSDPVRIQGAFVSTAETDRIMRWYRDNEGGGERAAAEPDILDMVRERDQEAAGNVADEVFEDWDDLFRQAAEVCIQHEQGSTSLLQRRLRIGYGRAARIVDQLEHAGVLGPPDGSKPREVLIGLDGLDLLLSGRADSVDEAKKAAATHDAQVREAGGAEAGIAEDVEA
jgi:DNA segregation ATPase FtsK/SpoIIIE, S-DNA-T family